MNKKKNILEELGLEEEENDEKVKFINDDDDNFQLCDRLSLCVCVFYWFY